MAHPHVAKVGRQSSRSSGEWAHLKRVGTIVDIRSLRHSGLSKSATARRLGIDRGTVSKYWEGPVDQVEAPQYPRRSTKVDAYSEYITSRLERYPELSAQQIYQEIQRQGYQGSARTVRRFVSGIRPRSARVYKPVEVLPGEQAQVDWGHFGTIVENGYRVKLYAFVFTLSWSRAMYVEFITSLGMATFAGCLHRALEAMNGVPETILFDNAKTVVSQRIGQVVQFNENLLRLAARYGFRPKACWIADPESKGRVESNVKYLRGNFFYGREFSGRAELNAAAHEWVERIAHQRIHGTTRRRPAEMLEEERPYLRPFVPGDGPMGIIERRGVGKDGLISVAQNKYSVPYQFQRKTIRIRRFEGHIEVLDQGKVICRHTLRPGRGQRFVLDEHYPPRSQSPRCHPLQAEFESLAPSAPAYLQGLSQAGVGSLREQMERITSLKDHYSRHALEAAMSRALEYQAFGYGRLKRILQRQARNPKSLPQVEAHRIDENCRPLGSRLQRDPAYYRVVIDS